MTDLMTQRETEKAIEFLCTSLTGNPPVTGDNLPEAMAKIKSALEKGWEYKKLYEEMVERE